MKFPLRILLLILGVTVFSSQGQTNETVNYYYDHEDRLVGAEYSRGISIAYQYDGNGNIPRQTVLSRASESTTGLPILWQFLNGLTNGTTADGAWGDADGDGWSNYAEWLAGTDPANSNSVPTPVTSSAGTNIATISLPFTPSNFVMAVGQLTGQGSQQIVIGADGNPGTNTNSLFILTQSYFGWTTQQVSIGTFGITSISIGQPGNSPSTNIYLGLRQAGDQGGVLELRNTNGGWQSNWVAGPAGLGFVYGVRQTGDLLVGNGTNGSVSSFFLPGTNGVWASQVISTNSSHRGLGTHALVPSRVIRDASVRLLDAGGIEMIGGNLEIFFGTNQIPNTAIFNPATAKWYYQTPVSESWGAAQSYFASLQNNLVTVSSSNENAWISSNFSGNYWIGAYFNFNTSGGVISAGWASGVPDGYVNWDPGENQGRPIWDQCCFNSEGQSWSAFLENDAWWSAAPQSYSFFGIGEALGTPVFYTNQWILPEPLATNPINWRGRSLTCGFIRPNQTNSVSIFYSYVEDVNSNGVVDSGDNFVTVEYIIQGNNWTTNTLVRVPITAATVAQSYALALANLVPYQSNILFTAEPDGTIYYWQATNTTSPLIPQLFTAAYQGKAWHALAGVNLITPGQALVGLRVDPSDQATCNVILWPPQYSLTPAVSSLPPTEPTAIVLPGTNILSALGNVPVSISDVVGNPATPFLQYQFAGSSNWLNATILNVDGQLYTASLRVATTPTGVTHTLGWNALGDLGPVQTNVSLRAQAMDVAMTGVWSAPVSYAVNTLPPFQINSGSTNLQLTTNGFQFQISGGDGNGPVVIYASTNLMDWNPILTNPPFIGATNIVDPAATNFRSRFYRAGEQ